MAVLYAAQALLFTLYSILITLNFSTCMAAGKNMTCNEKEKNALLSFKHGLADPSNRLSSWSNEEDCCRWSGVRCNDITGQVMELNLSTPLDSPYMELGGEIPISIGYLSVLESLLLDNNGFSGYIPSTLQNCSTLKFIDLGNNHLSNTLPPWIWEMQYLMVLRLRSNNFKGSMTQKMCHLSSLIVLDIANNSLTGSIPNCLDNMQTMAGEDDFFANPLKYSYGFGFNYDNYKESLVLVPKGDELEYRDNLILVRMIDLSSNNLSGAIPSQISKLSALRFLNLSGNHLSGEIPKGMGNMKLLESLDLSLNQISGEIPQSMSGLSFLSFLNLSCNNLSGRIPTGTQLQSFEALSYTGNPELCGPPVLRNCTNGEKQLESAVVGNSDGSFFEASDFYIGMGVGFAAGFWGVCSVIFFNRTWRHAYFRFLEHLRDLIYVTLVLKLRKRVA